MEFKNNLKNFKRRVKYFLSTTGGTLTSAIDLESINTPAKLARATAKLEKSQASHKQAVITENLRQQAEALGVQIPKNLKGKKALSSAKSKVSEAKKRASKGLTADPELLNRIEGYLVRQQAYNDTHGAENHHRKLYLRPNNLSQLKRFTRILSLAERGEYDKAHALLGKDQVDKRGRVKYSDQELSRKSSSREAKRHAKAGTETAKDWIMMNNALGVIADSEVPELSILIMQGGVPLLKELAKYDFNVFVIFDSEGRYEHYSADAIFHKLRDVAKHINEPFSSMITTFLNTYGE